MRRDDPDPLDMREPPPVLAPPNPSLQTYYPIEPPTAGIDRADSGRRWDEFLRWVRSKRARAEAQVRASNSTDPY